MRRFIFQANAKQEAELLHLREELAEAKATAEKLESEKKYLMCRLQTALLENHKLRNGPEVEAPAGHEEKTGRRLCDTIQVRLANEMAVIERVDWNAKKVMRL